MGYDPDHPMAEGEVGKVGVSIASVEDMQQLFAGIPLDKVTTSMTINATAAILLALYIAVAKQQGIEPRVLSGTLQNDILKEYIARGTYIYPPRPSLRLITDVFAYCAAKCRTGTPSRSAATTCARRARRPSRSSPSRWPTASSMSTPPCALDSKSTRFAPRLAFFFDSHNNLLEEVAKFRAARRMWARIMRDRFGARDPRSWMLRFHTQTAGRHAASAADRQQRRARDGSGAGGGSGRHTVAPHQRQRRGAGASDRGNGQLALRTQQVLAYESGVADVVDPLAGSYYVESLTDEIERRAWEYIERIDERGGALAAVESGYIQSEIQEAAYEYQRQVERGERIIVGTNRFQSSRAPNQRSKS